MTLTLLSVTYRLRAPAQDFRVHAETAAHTIARAPGLAWKIWGLDPETGLRRTLLLRPRLRERIRQRFAARREQLEHCFSRWNAAPLYVLDRFDPDAVTRYFYA